MMLFKELLEQAIDKILQEKKKEILNNVKLNITYNDVENIVKDKAFCLLSLIIDILSDDTDDFEAIEKIVCLLEDNNIRCGGRHDF